jgi:holo-[acyl-carrier protein] synthase
MIEKHGSRFSQRILTPAELELARRFRNPTEFIAGRWAAKEAILKMIGTGWRGGISWSDMEILPDELGRPQVALAGETARITADKGITSVVLSITHTKGHAAASAIGIGK